MVNLKQIVERYPEGLGTIRWGAKSYYEINSDEPLSLNSYGGSRGFILNDRGEVGLFDLSKKVLLKRHYYEESGDYESETDKITNYWWDEYESVEWWGKTLDNYYPHPWYPDKKIAHFEILVDIPCAKKGTVRKVHYISKDAKGVINVPTTFSSIGYNMVDLLEQPEFFKPIYDE